MLPKSDEVKIFSGEKLQEAINHPQFKNLGGTLVSKERFQLSDYCAVVYSDGTPVSIANLTLNSVKHSHQPEIPVFYTLPKYRGRGFGFVAFQRLLEFAQEQGIENIHIDVTSMGARKMIDALTPDKKSILIVHDSGFYLDSLMPQIEQGTTDMK